MITFEEAQVLHEGIRYDSMWTPRLTLKTSVKGLRLALDQAIQQLGTVELICLPWEHALSFQRQWEDVPDLIRSVRNPDGRASTDPWLWGYLCTYRAIDCWATAATDCCLVSGVRDLRKAWGPEDRVVLIEIS